MRQCARLTVSSSSEMSLSSIAPIVITTPSAVCESSNNGDMRVVERIHLADKDILHVDLEIYAPKIFTKSGLMVGLGESRTEIVQVMDDLRSAEVA